MIIIIIIVIIFIIMCSAEGQDLNCKCRNQGWSSAEGRSFTAISATKVAVLPVINRCSSFPLLSTPHSLFSIWTDLKRSQKIPRVQAWMWTEWIWLTGPSWHHRNSPQELNISSNRFFGQIRDPEIPTTLRRHIYHQIVLPKGRSFTANAKTMAAVLHKGRSSTANSGTKVVVVLGISRWGNFPLLFAPHSLISIWRP